jgi:hypothetical protein
VAQSRIFRPDALSRLDGCLVPLDGRGWTARVDTPTVRTARLDGWTFGCSAGRTPEVETQGTDAGPRPGVAGACVAVGLALGAAALTDLAAGWAAGAVALLVVVPAPPRRASGALRG